MRVRGSVNPPQVSVEDAPQKAGYSEIRLRENAKEITVTDEQSSHTEWEYDEYVLCEKTRANLKAEIEANLNEWLITGRCKEVDVGASDWVDAQDEITDLYDTLADAAQSEYDTLMNELEE